MEATFVVFFSLFMILTDVKGSDRGKDDAVYIVYMGGTASQNSGSSTHSLAASLLARKENAVVHSYKHGFSGFAARLSDQEAREMARQPGVLSVFRDPMLQLHTTHSWDFLQYQTAFEIDSRPGSDVASQSQGSDVIIGFLDSGIWPESDSFSDKNMGPIPSRWKGACMEGTDFSASNCNRKIIGARYYYNPEHQPSTYRTARDIEGHGTHVASTAAGAYVTNASYYGLAFGTARGGYPAARIATYRVCTPAGCPGSAVLAAFDDAIADGVDVLSISLGLPPQDAPDLWEDPISIGAFHAVQTGITVVCSAGNDGPFPSTVGNVAPWILTVAATTIDRDFETNVLLGNGKVVKGGGGINFANLQKSPVYPLIYGSSAPSFDTGFDVVQARKCNPQGLAADKIRGKIVICEDDTSDTVDTQDRINQVNNSGGVGIILINDQTRVLPSNFGTFPTTIITSTDAAEICQYVNSTRDPVATILPTSTVTKYKPAPMVPDFSSRGPSPKTLNILKPDIAAPGVSILAAWFGDDTDPSTTPPGRDPPLFNMLSGTSMACPHVSGVAANIKSLNPSWSPATIRSAIITTAIDMNNLKQPITTQTGEVATPYDYGAGEVNPPGSLKPGLVYEIGTADYLQFLCYYGFNVSTIKLISPTLPDKFTCPKVSITDMISNINYPSIAISENLGQAPISVSRTVTNVGTDAETVYNVSIYAPSGLIVKVIPDTLQFTKNVEKLSYQVIFASSSASAVKRDFFGTITWTNGEYKVRSPFVVTGG